eukprot:COSAG02_NODE_1133_length_14390_cov_3.493178_3_plen_173_part_00
MTTPQLRWLQAGRALDALLWRRLFALADLNLGWVSVRGRSLRFRTCRWVAWPCVFFELCHIALPCLEHCSASLDLRLCSSGSQTRVQLKRRRTRERKSFFPSVNCDSFIIPIPASTCHTFINININIHYHRPGVSGDHSGAVEPLAILLENAPHSHRLPTEVARAQAMAWQC